MKMSNIYFNKNQKGITLISLILTVVILIILAATTLSSIKEDGIIFKASRSSFISKVKGYEEELTLYINEKEMDTLFGFDATALSADKTTTPSIKDIIKSMSTADTEKFIIQEGKLVYIGGDDQEQEWSGDLGLTVGYTLKRIYGESVQEYGIELYNAVTAPKLEEIGYYLNSAGSKVQGGGWMITDYLPVDGYSFTLKNARGNAPAICAYDENKNLITGVQYNLGVSGVLGDKIIESTTKIKYIRYSVQPDTWTKTHGILVENLTPSYPIEIESVGDLVISEADQNYGKYKISLRISDKVGNQITTNIYLDEPLRKIGDYADYIDFKNQKVVRKIYEYTLNGTEEFTRTYGENLFDVQTMFSSNPFIVGYGLSNYYRYNSIQSGINANTVNGEFALQNGSNLFFKDSNYSSSASFKENLRNLYLAGKPVKVYYPLRKQTEETIDLPNIPTIKGTTILSVETTIQPSKIEK